VRYFNSGVDTQSVTLEPLADFGVWLKWAKHETLPPTRQRNQASRTREDLTGDEIERMIVGARHADGRLANRDVADEYEYFASYDRPLRRKLP